jgi:hypothetical protein
LSEKFFLLSQEKLTSLLSKKLKFLPISPFCNRPDNEVDVLIVPSGKDKAIDLYFGAVNNKYILVVANKIDNALITARKMRKKEKKAFIGEVSHAKEGN